jgi:hypothetical protein
VLFKRFLGGLDSGVVIVGIQPLGGHDLSDTVEAIKPVRCHVFEPSKILPRMRRFGSRTSRYASGLILYDKMFRGCADRRLHWIFRWWCVGKRKSRTEASERGSRLVR